jgi:hypothetical protein
MSTTETVQVTEQQYQTEALTIRQEADAVTIKSQQDYLSVATKMQTVKGAMKKAIEFFKPMKQAADAAKKIILDKEKSIIDPLTYAEGVLKKRMVAWDAAKEAERRAEEARLQAIAAKDAAKQMEKEAKKADKAGDAELAQAIREQPVAAPVVVVQKETPKVEGVSFIEEWKFRITDPSLVPREYLAVNEQAIRAVVKALKANTRIAGVEVYSEKNIRSRS